MKKHDVATTAGNLPTMRNNNVTSNPTIGHTSTFFSFASSAATGCKLLLNSGPAGAWLVVGT
jgi:hypothetical protein